MQVTLFSLNLLAQPLSGGYTCLMRRVYITRTITEAGINLLKESCEVRVQSEDRPATRQELLDGAAWADGMLTMLCDPIDRDLLSGAERLKGVANYAVGYDNIDLEAASEAGIGVSNTPDVLTGATAEMAWALLFAVSRKLVASDSLMRSGKWKGWAPMEFLGSDISGKTLGIIGAGRIGTAMGLMSKGFGMNVIYWNRSRSEGLEKELSARKVELDELVKSSDFISLHLPLSEETRHLIDRKRLEEMKNSAVLVNTGRGPLIDEAALVEALSRNQIAGAGLDVFEFEPKMAEGLAQQKNVVVTPHTGSATIGAREDMAVMAAENLLSMLEGRAGAQCLNPQIYT
jgi:glyoxylate reductase